MRPEIKGVKEGGYLRDGSTPHPTLSSYLSRSENTGSFITVKIEPKKNLQCSPIPSAYIKDIR